MYENVIDKKGFIVDSNNVEYVGYDMSGGKQSNEFVTALLENKKVL